MTNAGTSSAPVAENSQTPIPRRLLTVRELADLLNVSADYVYRHADDLAAIRLPGRDGERGRLRFHWSSTLDAIATVRSASERSDVPEPAAPAAVPASAPAPATGTRVRLLPVEGAAREGSCA
jgi:hypothetical protein